MKIALFDQDAPATVANFKTLALKKFYKGIVVHRIVPETLVQVGDPLSRGKDRSQVGTGGPGYTLPSEVNRHKHGRGAVAMAALPEILTGARLERQPVLFVLRPHPISTRITRCSARSRADWSFSTPSAGVGVTPMTIPLEQVEIRFG